MAFLLKVNNTVHKIYWCYFYRVMHYSAKSGLAIACRPSVCDVGDLWSHRLEILETNCTDN